MGNFYPCIVFLTCSSFIHSIKPDWHELCIPKSMKKLLLVLFVLITFHAGVSAQAKSFKDLIGKWEISGEEESASLEIIDSSNIYLTYAGDRKKVISYTFDLSKTPGWFDFSIPDSAGVIHVKSLFQV